MSSNSKKHQFWRKIDLCYHKTVNKTVTLDDIEPIFLFDLAAKKIYPTIIPSKKSKNFRNHKAER
jgi:hypothetical protein